MTPESKPKPEALSRSSVTMEFHVARAARERYGFEEPWFSLTGNAVLGDLAATRKLAYRMNQSRDDVHRPEGTVHPGQLHAMGLIDEILHYVCALYRQRQRPEAMARALEWLERRVGKAPLEAALLKFADTFPPLVVYRGTTDAATYLRGRSAGVSHREMVLEELLMLWLANVNPAFEPFRELFDDAELETTSYAEVTRGLAEFFVSQPPFGPDHQNLVEMLRSPAIASPQSLAGQLDYIRRRWGDLLGDFLKRLMLTVDVIKEEEHAQFMRFAVWRQNQRVPVSDFRGLEAEVERFTPDRDWMPHVVMMAKSAHVWLDQLSRQYGRTVARLDHIPDEELDQLSRWGFTALWLIGLWERSPASRRIKQLCGNPDAGASAYALSDYAIASELGGEAAFANLRERAGRRGIRLASDMVPNHMGIDSRWVIEHPDWFLSLDHSPYPAYRFGGPDLSSDPRVSIAIEEHYYDRSDAAVVFRRTDRHSGETRYVYHGNDGTLTPWNDTAQLNYLRPEVREGLIQTILHVARHFPIIRFDAAMTLAKRHYQRLWFPEPGHGGAIPSRAEHGMTKAEFDAAMPVEFWREVVDRVAAEIPDTLLLAEAFWLMEGYFVRTLGMHRVYNSAFMNMLRDEDNANYRSVIKNTLEFDPEILKRYVNFMNNPDERTAVDQFGKGDKYFGVCTLMATMPGLPMFGHGQIEGLTERYGMEFRRAAWDERSDRWLVERHEREIFPLLHRRHLWSGARDFLLYDFFTAAGHVNEDVFAYSNRAGDERGLVLFHNRYAHTAGWIRTSVAYSVKSGGGEKALRQRSVGEGLGLTPSLEHFCIFREHLSGLEYIRSSLEIYERGLYAELDAYRCQVFLDFREVRSDAHHPWGRLVDELGGRGVPSVDAALREIQLRPLVTPFRELVNAELFRELIGTRARLHPAETANGRGARTAIDLPAPGDGSPAEMSNVGTSSGARPQDRSSPRPPSLPPDVQALVTGIEEKVRRLVSAVRRPMDGTVNEGEIADHVRRELEAMLSMNRHVPGTDDVVAWGTLWGWLFAQVAERVGDVDHSDRPHREWLVDWTWDRALGDAIRELGAQPWEAARRVTIIAALVRHAPMFRAAAREARGVYRLLESLLADDQVQVLLRLNQYEGVWWFHRESWEELLGWLVTVAAVQITADPSITPARETEITACGDLARRMVRAAAEAEYRLDRLVAHVTA